MFRSAPGGRGKGGAVANSFSIFQIFFSVSGKRWDIELLSREQIPL